MKHFGLGTVEVFGEPGLVDERLPCTQVEPKFHDNDDDDGDSGDGDDGDSNNDVDDDDWYIKVKRVIIINKQWIFTSKVKIFGCHICSSWTTGASDTNVGVYFEFFDKI